jgi:signal transduction histidine kinase
VLTQSSEPAVPETTTTEEPVRAPSPGRIDRALDRLYARREGRVVFLVAIAVLILGLVTAISGDVIIARWLGRSVTDGLLIFAIWTPIGAALAILGALTALDQVRTMLAWSGPRRTQERAPRAWYAFAGQARLHFRSAAACGLSIPPCAVWMMNHFHKPLWGAVPVTIGGWFGIAGFAALIAFAGDLLVRPALTDVASRLPPEFEPKTTGTPVWVKAFAPLPVIALYGALLVGAYANLSTNDLVRYTFALVAALIVIAIAATMFMVINRSALRPLDDLTAATGRVRAGDLVTPVPVVSEDQLGALAQAFNRMLEGLREREALRGEVLSREEELRASRARIVAASDAERRRVERNIHDGAQQRLVALSLDLRMLEDAATALNAEQLAAMAAEAGVNLKQALDELRELARGLHPSVLETDGLGPALRQLASRSPIPVNVTAVSRRLPEAIESTAYFVASEALANVAKYAQASSVQVSVEQQNSRVTIRIADDGVGGARTDDGSGLIGLLDRVAALDGTLTIESPPDEGTVVTAELPNNLEADA